jgi:hypothetical protein
MLWPEEIKRTLAYRENSIQKEGNKVKDNLKVIECPPQRSRLEHPIKALRRENARAWALVWKICGLAIASALMAGLATGVLIAMMY